MSGSSSTAAKQDTNQFKKDNRGSTGNTSNSRDDKRSSDSSNFSNQSRSNQNRGQGHHGSQQQQQQHNENQNRDRSGGRNDSRQYEKQAQETKNQEKEEKAPSGDQPGAAPCEKKFTGRCRLFVGNLTPDMSEDEFRKMFEAYGEVSEVYANAGRGFGFIRLDYRHNAEAAKAALDGMQRKGRVLRVRFATHGAALKVKNLHPFVSNELLEQSFSQFGELERCVVIVDDRGKSTGEGIVEFVRKPGANSALRRITEGVFLMGIDPKPICVEPLEHKDEEDGLPEKFLTRNEQYKKEREKEPRFAPPGTFEYEFGMRWKQLEEVERQRIEQAKKDTEESRLKLEDEMQNALYDYQADQIRQELVRQQEELRRLEELRNQDRMRRQQEYDLRHQQEERERAQQEERRRADAMMMMRQQDIARGRGSMDMMKGRDDMMMGDRYGDRMPDHMSDRMGDRMSDRMGDRMPPGQPGYPPNMWDDKQRGDVGMRGDAGRGRVSGSQALQPPSVPPSAGAMERGGPPNPPATGGAAPAGAKTSPKPLMQTGAFSNIGNTSGGGPTTSTPNAPDGNPMDHDCIDDDDTSNFEDAEETNEASTADLGITEACLATFRSPDITCKDKPPQICILHEIASQPRATKLEPETCLSDSRMLVDMPHDSDADTISLNGSKDISKLSVEETGPVISNTISHEHSMSDYEIDHEDIEDSMQPTKCLDGIFQNTFDLSSRTDRNGQPNDNNSTPTTTYDNKFDTSITSVKTCSNSFSNIKLFNTHFSKNISTSCDVESDDKCSYEKAPIALKDRNIFFSLGNLSNDDVHVGNANSKTHELHTSSIDDDSLKLVDATSENFSSDTNIHHDFRTFHSEEGSQVSTTINHNTIQTTTNSQLDLPSQYSAISESKTHQEINESPETPISHVNSTSCSINSDIKEAVCQESNYPVTDTTGKLSCLLNQNITHESHNQSHFLEEDSYSLSEVDNYDKNPNNFDENHQLDKDSINQIAESNQVHDHPTTDGVEELSYIVSDAEAMETETVVEETACVPVDSGIYQSSEDVAAVYQAELVDINDIGNSDVTEVNPADGISEDATLTTGTTTSNVESSENQSTDVIEENKLPEATSLNENTASPSSSSSPSLSSKQTSGSINGDQEERVFSQGDQTFISATARQTSVPFLPAGCPLPYVAGMNPSMYAGAAMVQGMAVPTVMSSSSVHIAQHPGGATIMQQRHMSTGMNGNLAQATIMQQQAMPNGLQATSVMQRTLTNGGQTMVVQQRTMTTGLDGVTQQTVVQQQVAAPSMAQAALFHANAMRQRTLAAQQASMMQQRGIRLVQTGVMANPMMHAQPLGGAALIQRGTMAAPTALVGHSLIGGVSQGTMMQQIVRQRYLGGPVMPGRGVQLVAGRPIRL